MRSMMHEKFLPRRAASAIVVALVLLTHRAAASTIIVADGGDAAICPGLASLTLRCAIDLANASPPSLIQFAPGIPAVLIQSPLPTITGNGTWIDGHDSDGGCCVRIDGAFWTDPAGDAITINANDVTISNLKIVRIPTGSANADIAIAGGKDIAIAYNYLGILPEFTQCAGADAQAGVSITGDSSGADGNYNGAVYIYNNTIGCHHLAGVYALNSPWVMVGKDRTGVDGPNLVGVAADGIHAIGNGIGVYADLHSDNMAIRNNRIDNNTFYGIYSSTAVSTSVVFNEISNNASFGVVFSNGNSGTVIGNKIGTTSDGLGSAPNGEAGIAFVDAGSGNVVTDSVIAHNQSAGIIVEGASHASIQNNDIFANGGLPIDLGNDGPSPNGSNPPPGPNDWLPYPVITNASTNLITGTACANCTVFIFTAIGDPSRRGGGGKYLQNAFADNVGVWIATLPVGMTRDDIALTAVGGTYDSSEMSPRDLIFRNGFE